VGGEGGNQNWSTVPRFSGGVQQSAVYLVMASRDRMSVRIVPLGSAEASDPRMGGTSDERVQAAIVLSLLGWELSRRPFPSYTRATMPIRITSL
jgi:hypothetical protein